MDMNSKIPEFSFYFLKEQTRNYDKTELITLLTSNPNVSGPLDENNKKIYVYHHPLLNFEAKFVMSEIAVVPDADQINPKYLDVDFYVSFSVLLSNYAIELVLDMVEEICKRFQFFVYNQAFQYTVMPFRRPIMVKAFTSWKKAFASKYPEKVATFNFLDSQTLSQVYNYLLKRKRIELTLDKEKINVTNYIFLRTESSRSAYVAIKWDGKQSFILPPCVDLLMVDDGKGVKKYPMLEILKHTDKLFKPIDGYGDIMLLEAKYVKKFLKIITKEKYPPLAHEVKPTMLEQILDV